MELAMRGMVRQFCWFSSCLAKRDDLQLAPLRQVRLRGKVTKERLLPLSRETANALHQLRGMGPLREQQYVFVNRLGQPLTRDGVAYILGKYAAVAAQERLALAQKRITPHVLRHSCAVALLQSGTDVTVIRHYLGHASVTTTGRYIATNIQMKRDAMEIFWDRAGIEHAGPKNWKPEPDWSRSSNRSDQANLIRNPARGNHGARRVCRSAAHIKTNSRLWGKLG
jgi:integrase/recombinase XerD